MISDACWDFDRTLRESIDSGLARKAALELDEDLIRYADLFPCPELDYLRKLISDYLREGTRESFLHLWSEVERVLWFHDVGVYHHKLVEDRDGKVALDRDGRMQFEPLHEAEREALWGKERNS